MGEDKFENEELIKFGWPEDLWFHVDKLSSAHVYLRMPEDLSVSDVPEPVIQACAQLVKANSIEGCKLKDVDVVYTPWSNLKKTNDMAVGQVGFFKNKKVTKIKVVKDNSIWNRLKKTKREEKNPPLKKYRSERDQAERAKLKAIKAAKKQADMEARIAAKKLKEEMSYDKVLVEDDMVSNSVMASMTAEDYEDDFM